MATPFLLSLFALFPGCTKPPVYNQIASVVVHHQTSQGTTRTELEGEMLERAAGCLGRTTEVAFDPATSPEEPLQAIYLLQIVDRYGDRMFEMLTSSTFKGNKGKYYRNDCILKVIRDSSKL